MQKLMVLSTNSHNRSKQQVYSKNYENCRRAADICPKHKTLKMNSRAICFNCFQSSLVNLQRMVWSRVKWQWKNILFSFTSLYKFQNIILFNILMERGHAPASSGPKNYGKCFKSDVIETMWKEHKTICIAYACI